LASDLPELSGRWRPPGAARSTPASLVIDPHGMVSVREDLTGRELVSTTVQAMTVSARVGSIPRHIDFPDESSFETGDNDGLDRLLRPFSGRGAGVVHELEKFRPRLVVFVVMVIALGFGIYRYAVPALVEVAIAATPPVVPRLMSQSVMLSLDQTVFDKTTASEQRRREISDGFAALAALTPRGATPADPDRPAVYTLNFRKGGAIGPNAFALPDGTVIITDELLELVPDNEVVLAVLGHEIGHVDHEHSLRQLYRAAGIATLIMMIGGDIGSGAEDVLVQGTALLSLSHSREAEAQADRFSVEIMHKAGRDPAALARFFEMLRDKLGDKGTQDFFSTHPATPERIEEVRRYAEEVAARKD